jgi:dihydroorotase
MREWTKTLLGAAASLVIILGMPANTLAQTPRYDLLLKGGHVIDPANHVDAVTDVAVSKDKIAAVEKEIPASQAEKVVDASGLYVTIFTSISAMAARR